MAQEVEHVLGKDEVAGSNPAISSTKYHHIWWYFSIFPPKYGIFETFLATSRKKSRYNCIQSGTIANFLSANCKVELFPDYLSVRNALKRPDSALFADICKRLLTPYR